MTFDTIPPLYRLSQKPTTENAHNFPFDRRSGALMARIRMYSKNQGNRFNTGAYSQNPTIRRCHAHRFRVVSDTPHQTHVYRVFLLLESHQGRTGIERGRLGYRTLKSRVPVVRFAPIVRSRLLFPNGGRKTRIEWFRSFKACQLVSRVSRMQFVATDNLLNQGSVFL
jgi:hypothetical protein